MSVQAQEGKERNEMPKPLSDTHPDIEKRLIMGLRQMPGWRKLQLVQEMNEFADALAMADVRRHYPNADERECCLRVASRRVPADLMRKAFGWDPNEKGY